jgi:hypothetical protein
MVLRSNDQPYAQWHTLSRLVQMKESLQHTISVNQTLNRQYTVQQCSVQYDASQGLLPLVTLHGYCGQVLSFVDYFSFDLDRMYAMDCI